MIQHLAPARAHSLFLSAEGMTIKHSTRISPVERDTVSTWIRKGARDGPARLQAQPRSGSPPTLTLAAPTLAIASSQAEPRALTQVVARLSQHTAQRLRMSSLQRLAKRARLRWTRVRQSCKRLRDPVACARGQWDLAALQHQEDQGKIAL